ncbi:ArsI/CadI family heavy metal resistance metalloenzyme [Schlesneria paludicola]|uniref:ArsI/CadI family heavy metal resistance metalloenzyme n=1 Tax=Schlesneria paludicola TaxID=360056 RepID=UPI00029ABA36|nr:ArsI/CadI family heavy metal resistance metalloenzyme [Schlesneria paludicola]
MTVQTCDTTILNRTPVEAISQVKFHASLNVSDLNRSVPFYAALFGESPVKWYEDYAKFELNEPPLVLSLKPKRACTGGPLNHLGLRLTSLENLEAVLARMKSVNARIGRQDDVQCCYAHQSKLWITDPDGTLWEVYVFHNDVPDWGEKHNKVKLWSAPLKAFGIRGMLSRWWNNAFGPKHLSDQSAVEFESPIPADTCQVPSPTANS